MKITAEELLEILTPSKSADQVQFAVIAPGYVSGKPFIILDGSDDPSVKTYPRLASYTPVSGDRVMVLKGVILGKIV